MAWKSRFIYRTSTPKKVYIIFWISKCLRWQNKQRILLTVLSSVRDKKKHGNPYLQWAPVSLFAQTLTNSSPLAVSFNNAALILGTVAISLTEVFLWFAKPTDAMIANLAPKITTAFHLYAFSYEINVTCTQLTLLSLAR